MKRKRCGVWSRSEQRTEQSSSGVVVMVVVMVVGEGIEYVSVSKRREREQKEGRKDDLPSLPLPKHTYKFQTYSTSLTEAKSNGVRPLEC